METIGIAAVARNGVIGADGGIPWRLPADLARFKTLTMGQILIMGRKTYDSIGRPLPGRISIVVTRDPDWQAVGVEVAGDLPSAFSKASLQAVETGASQVFVAGGGEIYRLAWDRLDRLEITEVDLEPAGEVKFPAIGADWTEASREQHDGFAYVTWTRDHR